MKLILSDIALYVHDYEYLLMTRIWINWQLWKAAGEVLLELGAPSSTARRVLLNCRDFYEALELGGIPVEEL